MEDVELQTHASYGSSSNKTNEIEVVSVLHAAHVAKDVDSSFASTFASVEEDKTDIRYWYIFIVFMIMGSGANWIFATALAQEIPYFQEHLPGGLCIGAYMNAATQINFFFVISYLILRKYVSLPHTITVPFILVLGAFGSFLTAGTYKLLTEGFPLALYICCVIGGIVGGLSAVIMQPFLTYFKNDFISAARSGGSAGMILTALLAIAQDPGASNQHYSVGIYFVVFGVILSLSVEAYFYILHTGIGLRNPEISPLNSTSYIEAHNSLKEAERQSCGDVHLTAMYDSQHGGDGRHSGASSIDPSANRSSYRKYTDPISDYLLDTCVPAAWFTRFPWLRVTLPYLITVAWIDFNTWGLLSSLIPFAMKNVSLQGGALNLAIAYEASAFTLFLGDFSTIYFRLPYLPALFVFTTFAVVIYAFAGSPQFEPSLSTAPIIIAVWCIGRYIEAHLLTQSYRAVASELPLKYREEASRWVGFIDQVFSFIGTILSTAIVVVSAKC